MIHLFSAFSPAPLVLASASSVLGEYALMGVILTAVAVAMASLAYVRLENAGLLRFVRLGLGLMAALLSVASWVLLKALLDDNFALDYVASHSEKALATGYKVAAFWAGQEGSLLLWAWVLGVMGVLMALRLRKMDSRFAAVTLGVMALVTGFFTCIMLFVVEANPFTASTGRSGNGMGLNPQLQHLAMVFHPPLLFLGYAGFTAPFAYLIAGLCTKGQIETKRRTGANHEAAGDAGVLNYATARNVRVPQVDDRWLHLARPWMVFSWIMLTVGIVLGAQWAYLELGWGGYWAWDPVENASLLPWLTGTALLHAAVLQVRNGIFKRWTASLTAASFFLCIFGTYLTRSGVIQSVHAFQESPIGNYFLVFMGVILLVSVVLILARLKHLAADRPLEAIVSREGFFLLGLVLLTVMTLTTIVGTLSPLISAVLGTTVTANAQFYNKIILPMALLLAALMATGPVLGSGAEALDRASKKLAGMLIAGAAAAAVVFMLGHGSLWAMASAAIVTGVLAGVAIDVTGTVAHGGFLRAIVTRHRHWGAQFGHLGLAAMVAGIAGSSLYGDSKDFVLHPNANASTQKERSIGGYVVDLQGLTHEERANHNAVIASIQVTSPGGTVTPLTPEKRFYDRDPRRRFPDEKPAYTTSEVAILPGALTDVYMTIAGWENSGQTVAVTVRVNPLVNWIWAGGILMTLGGLLCLIPGKQEVAAAAAATTEVPPAEQALPPPLPVRGTKRERRRAEALRQNPPLTEGR